MTEDRLPLADLLAKAGDGDFLRSVAEAVLQMLMEADVEGLVGAGRHERTGERLNYRNGFRDRTLDTRLGALQLLIPKLLHLHQHTVDRRCAHPQQARLTKSEKSISLLLTAQRQC
jgi:transposase-like protein